MKFNLTGNVLQLGNMICDLRKVQWHQRFLLVVVHHADGASCIYNQYFFHLNDAKIIVLVGRINFESSNPEFRKNIK